MKIKAMAPARFSGETKSPAVAAACGVKIAAPSTVTARKMSSGV